jgi:hypothetical protein
LVDDVIVAMVVDAIAVVILATAYAADLAFEWREGASDEWVVVVARRRRRRRRRSDGRYAQRHVMVVRVFPILSLLFSCLS